MSDQYDNEKVPPQRPKRTQILEQGIDITMGDRNDAYGDPAINLDLQMRMWNCYKSVAHAKHSEAHDAAMQHVFAKIARIAAGSYREDNYLDLSVYAAIACECEDAVMNLRVGRAEQIESIIDSQRKER